MENWIGIIGTLLGSIAGAATTYFIADAHARRQMKWESIKLAQAKLEEVAQLLDEVAHHYKKISGAALMKVQLGKPIELNSDCIPHGRLSMLVNFYAPEIAPDLKELKKITDKYGEVFAEAIRDVKRDMPKKQELNARLLQGSHQIDDKCDEISVRASALAKSYVEALTSNPAFNRDAAKARRPSTSR